MELMPWVIWAFTMLFCFVCAIATVQAIRNARIATEAARIVLKNAEEIRDHARRAHVAAVALEQVLADAEAASYRRL